MKVSVVIPTKNRCNLLVQCLQSVLAQSFRDFEVIIINDGSEDATQETVEVFKDDRIRYFELPRSIGIPKARNFGLLQAKGEYVAIVDDDDIQLPHRFEEQVKKLDDGFDVAYGGWVSQGNGRNFVRKSCPFSLARLLLIGKMCSHGGLMIRKSTLEKESYNEGLMYGSDYELVIRLAARGYRFGRIDRIMNIIRVQDDGVTILNKDYQRNVGELAVKNAFEEMSEEERKEIFEVLLRRNKLKVKNFNLGELASATGNYSGAEIEKAIDNAMLRGFREKKRKIKTKDIVEAARAFKPLYKMREGDFDDLKEWAETRCLKANASIKNMVDYSGANDAKDLDIEKTTSVGTDSSEMGFDL